MPRRKAGDGAPPAPKAPRSRKKKVNPEENKPPDAYDPMMQPNYMDGMEGGMYPHHEYVYPGYGQPPPFGSPEPANSPYIMPQQSNTPQPQMIMRSMPPPPQQSTPTQLVGPAPSALEFRIHEMNRRLYIYSSTGISESDQQQWWDAFSHEFFDDDCKLWFVLGDDTIPAQEREKYCVGRNTVPRFFRSIFDSGMKELIYVLRGQSRECQTSTGCPAYENDNVLQVTKFDNPVHTEVNTECRFYAEFTQYDEVLNYRIRAWTLEMKQSEEYAFNDMLKEYERIDGGNPDRMQHTKMGFFKQTLSMMSLARILEPMQMIMSTAKSNGWGTDPRDLMKRTLFYHYTESQRKQEMQMRQMSASQMIMPATEPEKPKPVRKRQRKPAVNSKAAKKTATANAQAAAAAAVAANASPAPTNPAFQPNPMTQSFSAMGYQDVMVVGEPSMMGGEFGDEDERTISRVENAQYDPNAMQMQQLGQGPPQQMGNGPNMSMGPSVMGPPQNQMSGGMPNQMGAQAMPPPQMPPNAMNNQMPNQMPNPMNNQMVNSMHMQNSIPNSMPGGMNPNQMPNQIPQQMPNQMPNSMGIPMSMPNPMPSGMPNQMPNTMAPGYSFQQQQQWPQPPNSAMITG